MQCKDANGHKCNQLAIFREPLRYRHLCLNNTIVPLFFTKRNERNKEEPYLDRPESNEIKIYVLVINVQLNSCHMNYLNDK